MCGTCDPRIWIAIAAFTLIVLFGLMPTVQFPAAEPVEPIAEFTATPDSGLAPLAVTFDAGFSHDPDGKIAEYNWDFGDGSHASGSLVSHIFATEGSYVVTLQVTDNTANTSTVSMVIEASAPQPEEPEPSEESTPGEGESGT